MYNTDSHTGYFTKKQDLDINLSWMADDRGVASPYEFPGTVEDGSGGYSFETFPQEMPPIGGDYPPGFPDMGLYTTAVRGPLDTFGFPTELQLPAQGLVNMQKVMSEMDQYQGSSEQSSNRKSTTPPTTAQVKNRKAQKKFRERQKAKMMNLSEEVETLRKRVENLSVENRDLENSNMLLNKVIKMRDRQMNILKARTESMVHEQKDSRNEKLPELLQYSEGEVLSMERSLEVANHLSANFPASKFTNINQTSMKDVWKQYVDLLGGMLMNYDVDPDNTTILKQIQVAVAELGEICMNCATMCPSCMCALVATGDTPFTPSADSDEVQAFWKNVLTSLKLTPHQERLLLELRSRFLQHLETVWKKRTLLSNRLQSVVMSKGDVFKSNINSCRSGSGVREVFEELRETCLTDGQYHTDFIASFFQIVLEDVQTARVHVESFPYYPDVLQISNLVYKKHQEERQAEASKTKSSPSVALTVAASAME